MCRIYIYIEQLVFGNLVAACVLQARPRRSPPLIVHSLHFSLISSPRPYDLIEIAKLVDKPWEVLTKGDFNFNFNFNKGDFNGQNYD